MLKLLTLLSIKIISRRLEESKMVGANGKLSKINILHEKVNYNVLYRVIGNYSYITNSNNGVNLVKYNVTRKVIYEN